MEMKERSASQPSVDFGMFVGGVIVDHEIHIEIARHTDIDVSHESERILLPVVYLVLVVTSSFAMSSVANRVVVPGRA